MINKNLLSIIVPVYQGITIDKDLERISRLCKAKLKIPYEIICVVDGLSGPDDTTLSLAKKSSAENLKVYHYEKNRGKGYAVRFGVSRSKGSLVSFIDAGSDIHPLGLITALETLLRKSADIVIGSKRHKDSIVKYPPLRLIYSRTLNFLTKHLLGLNFSDTQVGLKMLKREVIETIDKKAVIDRWAFDLELLVIAKKLGFRKIIESPVKVTYNFSSNISSGAILSFIKELAIIWYRLHIIRAYDKK